MSYEDEYFFILPNYDMKESRINIPSPTDDDRNPRDGHYVYAELKSQRRAPAPPVNTLLCHDGIFISQSHCPNLPEILGIFSTHVKIAPVIYIDRQKVEHLYWRLSDSGTLVTTITEQSISYTRKPFIDVEQSIMKYGTPPFALSLTKEGIEVDYDLGAEYYDYSYFKKLILDASILDQTPLEKRLFLQLSVCNDHLVHHSMKSIFESPQITLMSIAERNAVEWQTKKNYG